jgi:hypothetical protein
MPGNIPPTTWGPFFWHTIHLVALGYPNEPTYAEKRAAKEFYESLQFLIPCPVCKIHYQEHLKATPVTPSLDNRKDLFRWTVELHNRVNKDLGKPQYTEADSIAFYQTLGKLGRSPVYTPDDMNSMMFSKAATYGSCAIAFLAVAGGLGYYFSSNK